MSYTHEGFEGVSHYKGKFQRTSYNSSIHMICKLVSFLSKTSFLLGPVRPSEAICAIESLSELQDTDESIVELSKFLQDDQDIIVRSLAAEALAQYKGHDSASDALIAILESPSAGSIVRCAVARALGKIGGDRAHQALIKSLKSINEDPIVTSTLVKVLGKVGDAKAIPSIAKLFSSMDDPHCPPYLIRTFAADALGKIGSLDGVAILKRAHKSDSHSSVRHIAEKALDRIAKLNGFSSVHELLSAKNVQ